jgi:hypothetical protein
MSHNLKNIILTFGLLVNIDFIQWVYLKKILQTPNF